ncbi:MAG: hypothetical protein EHM45_24745 [Desulfobacteraceae bacterium]|nr:MAG: hypothetical protein EHM45_24745 [Desulfobacteraceae bacterium]
MKQPMAESGKREMERFDLNLAATVFQKKEKAPPHKHPVKMRTKNICAGGAFLLTDTPFPVGTRLDVGIRLAFLIGNRENERQSDVLLTGSVIRTDSIGMAVKFDKKYLFSPVSSQKNAS